MVGGVSAGGLAGLGSENQFNSPGDFIGGKKRAVALCRRHLRQWFWFGAQVGRYFSLIGGIHYF
jgi:hypothetical protein